MALHLSSSVTELPGIGSEAENDLRALGMVSLADLLEYFPYRYDDFSNIKTVAELKGEETVSLTGVIKTISMRLSRKNHRLMLTEAVFEDETGVVKVVWFNQPYLVKTLKAGAHISLAGRVDVKFGTTLTNPIWEKAGSEMLTGHIVPVYGLFGSLTMRRLRTAIKAALGCAPEMADWMPEDVCRAEKFIARAEAIRQIHFPDSKNGLEDAIDALKFEELFLHQLMFAHIRRERAVKRAYPVPTDADFLRERIAALPFTLTNAQQKALKVMMDDLSGSSPMNRLLQGDVGSGKTVVAGLAIAGVLRAGHRAAYLAPTEILARQQQAVLSHLLDEPVGLLTSSCKEREDAACVVGTHAFFHAEAMQNLALVVIDEQHRFGVEQRHALLDTGKAPSPHLLSMSATPIPRSLALSLYGDLDVSIIDELPSGRRPIETRLIADAQKKEMWERILLEVRLGHQLYVVCPLIDSSDSIGSRSIAEAARALQRTVLKRYRVDVLHGKMKPQEKEDVMARFKEGKTHALVSTTVIEVGVDIPNATVMLIVGAERFGLAQLHQLRGRVGRSDKQSYCFLRPGELSDNSRHRLEALEKSTDGFELAEMDLQLRGPGNVFGNAQSGFPDFKLATVADAELMKKARDHAARLLEDDPGLEHHPRLRERVTVQFDTVHLE